MKTLRKLQQERTLAIVNLLRAEQGNALSIIPLRVRKQVADNRVEFREKSKYKSY